MFSLVHVQLLSLVLCVLVAFKHFRGGGVPVIFPYYVFCAGFFPGGLGQSSSDVLNLYLCPQLYGLSSVWVFCVSFMLLSKQFGDVHTRSDLK